MATYTAPLRSLIREPRRASDKSATDPLEPPSPQLRRRLPMTPDAQRTNVLQIAFAAALHHRDDVIGVPQAAALPRLQSPPRPRRCPLPSAQPPQLPEFRDAVHPALSADAGVALQHAFPQVPGVAAQLPFIYAPVRAERPPAPRDFQIAPPAQVPAVRPSQQRSAIHPAAWHGPRSAHQQHFRRNSSFVRDARRPPFFALQ